MAKRKETVTVRWHPGPARKGFAATILRTRSPTRSAVWRSAPASTTIAPHPRQQITPAHQRGAQRGRAHTVAL